MDAARSLLTTHFAELRDPVQERRFRRYYLLSQRRAAAALLAAALLAHLAGFLSLLWRADSATPPAAPTVVDLAVPGTIVAVGTGLVIALLRSRRPAQLYRLVHLAGIMLAVAVAALITTGDNMGFRGSILLICGALIIYISQPLPLRAVTALSLFYSAVTIPAWLVTTDAWAASDVGFTLAATGVAHLLGFATANRVQRGQRALFAQRQALTELSAEDPLTGLFNRRALDGELALAWSRWRKSGTPVSLVMADIDHFKTLNDTQGHAAGDRALALIAESVKSVMPGIPGQAAVRYGGDEIVCLLPNMSDIGAAAIAERLLLEVRRAEIPVSGDPNDGTGNLSVSVGVASAHLSMSTAHDLLTAADHQLYRAKQSGRDRVCVFRPAEPMLWETDGMSEAV